MTVQRILRDVDQSVLVLSLKASTEEIKEHILSNVSQRQKERILEDLQYLGAVKVSEVEAAQRKIVDVIRSLEGARRNSNITRRRFGCHYLIKD